MIPIAVLALSVLYIAFVVWITFGKDPGSTTPSFTGVERAGCLAVGLGFPLIIGGLIAVVVAPVGRAFGWAGVAAGVLGITGWAIAHNRNQRKLTAGTAKPAPGTPHQIGEVTAPPPSGPAAEPPVPPPAHRPGPRDWVQTDPRTSWMHPQGPPAAPLDPGPPAALPGHRPAPGGAAAAQIGWSVVKAVGGVVALLAVAIPLAGLIGDAVQDNRREKERRAQQAFLAAPIPQITVGTAPAEPAKLDLPEIRKVDVGRPDQWPAACALVSDDDVRALLPQATAIRREGESREMRFLTRTYHIVPGSGPGLPTLRHQSVMVPEQNCEIRFQLPHKYRERPVDGVGALTVEVEAMGHPKAVAGFAPIADRSLQKFAAKHKAGFCSDRTGSITCTKKQLTLTVGGTLQHLHYPLGGGDDVPVLRFPGQPDDATADYYQRKVVREIMGLLLRKTP